LKGLENGSEYETSKIILKIKNIFINSNNNRKIHETKLPLGGNGTERENNNENNPMLSAYKVNEYDVWGSQGSKVVSFLLLNHFFSFFPLHFLGKVWKLGGDWFGQFESVRNREVMQNRDVFLKNQLE
jgi:hypothetical protein